MLVINLDLIITFSCLISSLRTVIAPMIEVFGGKAAYSNFWGGMDEEVI